MKRMLATCTWLAGIALSLGAEREGDAKGLSPVARDRGDLYDQRAWKREHGLPDNRVWAVCQTRDGYLWIGTQGGLARFDGQKFTVFNHLNTPALANDDCRRLIEDGEGALWISTGSGIVRKRGSRFETVNTGQEVTDSTTSWPPFCASRSGGIWASVGQAAEGRIVRVRHDMVKEYRPNNSGALSGKVFALDEDEAGDLWIGSSNGLARLNARAGRFEAVDPMPELARRPVTAIWHNARGEQWAIVADYIPVPGQIDPKIWLLRHQQGRWVNAMPALEPLGTASDGGGFILGDADGALWLSASEASIHSFANGQVRCLSTLGQRGGNRVSSACLDHEGSLWIGTTETGLERWNPRMIRTITSEDGLVHDEVWSISEAGDRSVWIGTEGGVSQFKDGAFLNFPMSPEQPESSVRSIVEDRNGCIWFGTIRAIHSIRDGKASRFLLPGDWTESKVRALHRAGDGGIWIGTVRGLTRLQAGRATRFTMGDGLGSDEVRAVLESRTGALWIGTLGGGLSQFREGRFTTFTTKDGLSNNNVWALHEDGEGVLWIGTEDGLNRLSDGTIHAFTRKHGLPEGAINCLLEDDAGRLWPGQDRGIYWVSKSELEEVRQGRRATVRPVRYDETDGLLSLEVNGQQSNPSACRTSDGRLWFPTSRGVAVVNPAKAAADQVAPVPLIEEIRANGSLLEREGLGTSSSGAATLRFGPGKARVLEFRFTAGTFVAPEKARFRYRLSGVNEHWTELGTRRDIHFTDLKPGDYRLQVSACSHHGVWHEPGASLAFNISPLFYQTWWFYAGTGGGLLAIAGLAIRCRIGELRKIHRLERINALNEQRKQIGRDIHDELGASLTRIVKISAEACRHVDKPEKVRQQAERIATIAEEAVDTIGGIVWANNPSYDSVEDLIAYLREQAAGFFAETAIQVSFELPEAVPNRTVSGLFRRNVVMILREALQNVCKHANAEHVRMRIRMDGPFELSVTDDGRGFSPDDVRVFANGLSHMRQRISELNGTLEIKSDPGQGTAVCARIPLPQNG